MLGDEALIDNTAGQSDARCAWERGGVDGLCCFGIGASIVGIYTEPRLIALMSDESLNTQRWFENADTKA